MIVFNLLNASNDQVLYSTMVRRGCYRVFCVFLVISLTCCKEDIGVLNIPDGDLGGDYSLAFTDTTTVRTSTVLLDSIPTSTTDNLLVGKYTDERLGDVEAKTFFQIWMGTTSQWKPKNTVFFDSLVLVMSRSDYYYGDTTVAQTFEVKEVIEDFQSYNLPQFWIDQGYYSGLYAPYAYYNKTNYVTGATLGSFDLKRRRNKKDSITVRLDQNVGQKWLQDALKTTGSPFNSNRDFVKYFKGISIQSTSAASASIIGLGSTDKVKIRLYIHEIVNGTRTGKPFTFSFSQDAGGFLPNKFNNVTAERGALSNGLSKLAPKTLLAPDNKMEIPSALTNEETYIHSSVGIVTKIRFPHIKQLLSLPGVLQVTDAKLVIRPVKDPKRYLYPLPKQLILFTTDNSNLPRTVVRDDLSSQPNPQTATLVLDNELNINSGYTFTITQYIKAMLSTQANVTEQAFLLSTPINDLEGTVNRIALGSGINGKYSVTLEILYLRKNE